MPRVEQLQTIPVLRLNSRLARGELFYTVKGFGNTHVVLAKNELAAIGLFRCLLGLQRGSIDHIWIAGEQAAVPDKFVVFDGYRRGRPSAKIVRP